MGAGASGRHRIRGRAVGLSGTWELRLREGLVEAMEPVDAPEEGDGERWIGPTLLDIQVNGAFGIDLQSGDAGPDALRELGAALARHGVSQWVPTIITGPPDRLLRACRAFGEAIEGDAALRACAPGLHIEGPYISPEDGPRGAHAREHVRPPDAAEFDRLYEAARGRILYVTVAPEMPGAAAFIAHCTARGVAVALGHHLGGAEDIARAVDAGARLSTHLGNGIASILPRHHNPIWPQLAEDRLYASLIADLHHLPAPVLKAFVRAKGADRVILVSDAAPPAGLAPGRYDLAGIPVDLHSDGLISLAGTDLLAGSGMMLLQGVVNAARATDLSMTEAFRAARENPARLLGLPMPAWPPEVGGAADLIAFEVAGDGTARVREGYVRGRAVPKG